MIVQCLDCAKKYRLKAEGPPPEGAVVRCQSCGQAIKVARRDNQDQDKTKLSAFQQDVARETKWRQHMVDLFIGWGYRKGTVEMNALYALVSKLRKMYGMAFVPVRLKLEHAHVERELDYSVLHLVSEACLPLPDQEGDSPLRKLLVGLWDGLKTVDYSGRFALREIMPTPYKDSFPAMFAFTGTAACGPKAEPLALSQVTFSVDALRALPPDLDLAALPQAARVRIGPPAPEEEQLSFAQRVAPGLTVRPLDPAAPAPDCAADLFKFWAG
jgi:predicted Zn finger-like uncharacterized protein